MKAEQRKRTRRRSSLYSPSTAALYGAAPRTTSRQLQTCATPRHSGSEASSRLARGLGPGLGIDRGVVALATGCTAVKRATFLAATGCLPDGEAELLSAKRRALHAAPHGVDAYGAPGDELVPEEARLPASWSAVEAQERPPFGSGLGKKGRGNGTAFVPIDQPPPTPILGRCGPVGRPYG
jgi:hypothetical protein